MRKLIIPTLLTIIGLAVLISLGTWQIQRHTWKQNLFADIRAGMKAEALDIIEWKKLPANEREVQFRKLRLQGTLSTQNSLRVYALHKGNPGYMVLAPLTLEDGTAILVNRGFMSEQDKGKLQEASATGDQTVDLTGYIRKTEQGNFVTPPPDYKTKLWYVADIPDMARQIGGGKLEIGFFIDVDAKSAPENWLQGREPEALLKSIPNHHMQYAITWYGLALAMLGVFIAFAVSRLRD